MDGPHFRVNGSDYQSYTVLNVSQGSRLLIEADEDFYGSPFDHWSDNYGFYSENITIIYKVPEENQTTLIGWYRPVWGHSVNQDGESYSIEFGYGLVNNVTNYYGTANHIQYDNGKLFVQFDTGQSYPLEILNVTTDNITEIVIYWQNMDPSVAVCGKVGNVTVSMWKALGDLLYVTHAGEPLYGKSTFEIYNISNITDPVLIGYVSNITDWSYWGTWIDVVEDRAYVCSEDGFYVVNVTDPSNPEIICEDLNVNFYNQIGWERSKLVVIGNYTYIRGIYGIAIIDISNLPNVRHVSIIRPNVTIYDYYIHDDLLYLACGVDGVLIYNISDKENPELIVHYNDTARSSRAIEYYNGMIIVADYTYGVTILNATNLDNITEICHIDTPDFAKDIEIVNNKLYISCFLYGILVYNLTDPENITFLTSFDYTKYFGLQETGDQMQIYIGFWRSKESSYYYGDIRMASGDLHGRNIQMYTKLIVFPIMLYNDTNGDQKPTQIPSPNPYDKRIYEGYEFLDFRYLSGSFTNYTIFIPTNGTYIIKEGKVYLYFNFTIANLSLVTENVNAGEGGGLPYYSLDLDNGTGKANITYGFWLLWENGTVELKIDMQIKVYDLNFGNLQVNNFSIFTGFQVGAGYITLGSIHGLHLNLTAAQGGQQFFSILGTKLAKLDMSGNYKIIRNRTEIYCGGASSSIMLPYMGDLAYPDNILFGTNFHGIKENDTIIYDPTIKTSKAAIVPSAVVTSKPLDTDRDGMPDYWENKHNLDPTDPTDANEDNDNDGLTNLEEYQHGTDPTDNDTDNDGITDGTEVSTYNTDPTDSDTDNDTMPDGWEIQYGLNPANAADADQDNDNDGLTNLEEYQHGTDPNDADTDNDGALDGDEIVAGTDPLDPASYPAAGKPIDWKLIIGIIMAIILISAIIFVKRRR